MLRPERMSRVSVAGSRRVLDDVVETVHDLNLLHLSDYDGSWEGFEPGDPIEGADEASEKLVTTRSLQNVLDVDEDNAGPARIVDAEEAERELEDVRQRVNELDDRRDDLEDELQEIGERRSTMETLSKLGIDLDLLGGYDTLRTRVGEGNPDEIDRALADTGGIDSYELFTGEDDRVVAVFARPAEGSGTDDAFDDALVGVEFTPIAVPDAEGSPEEYAAELGERRTEVESELEEVETELRGVREETGDFLLATEEHLAIDVQKREVPLSFATTENAFVAEGWIPTERYVDLAEALQQTVGDHVEIDELERASYDGDGAVRDREPVEGGGAGEPTAADGGAEVRTDGGPETAASEAIPSEKTSKARTDGGHGGEERPMAGRPPVVQDNPNSVKPFETLVRVLNRPQYSEFDPSFLVFLTFPLFFGFMIGDVGYGLLYLAIGYLIFSRYDGALGALGAIAMWSGAFTTIFGVLYGEIFGLHLITEYFWVGALGLEHPPIEKGLSPATVEWAQLWLVVSLLVGLLHVTAGYVLGFAKDLQHGFKDALLESGSWAILMLGVWTWILSRAAAGSKPEFLFEVFNGHPFPFGFGGFPEIVGWIGLGLGLLVGLPLMVYGEIEHLGSIGAIAGVLESLNVLVNVLSYARIAAVLLAKAGMAFVVNLLFFGAYQHDGEFHFLIDHGPQWVVGEYGAEAIMFPGLIHMGIVGILVGLVVVVVGHALVLVLGITSAGLQAVRLEYVEFFQKFYDGGGDPYEPFGYDRRYTADE